jgi:uncharacterized protein YceK
VKLLVVVLVLLSGCAAILKPLPVPQPTDLAPAGACMPDDAEAIAGSCGQLQSPELYFCTLCRLDKGCIDKKSFSYCTGAFGCDDPYCAKR